MVREGVDVVVENGGWDHEALRIGLGQIRTFIEKGWRAVCTCDTHFQYSSEFREDILEVLLGCLKWERGGRVGKSGGKRC